MREAIFTSANNADSSTAVLLTVAEESERDLFNSSEFNSDIL